MAWRILKLESLRFVSVQCWQQTNHAIKCFMFYVSKSVTSADGVKVGDRTTAVLGKGHPSGMIRKMIYIGGNTVDMHLELVHNCVIGCIKRSLVLTLNNKPIYSPVTQDKKPILRPSFWNQPLSSCVLLGCCSLCHGLAPVTFALAC